MSQWDYSKGHGPTCNQTLGVGPCNCAYGAEPRREQRTSLPVAAQALIAECLAAASVSGAAPQPDIYRTVKASGDVAELDKECSRLIALGWAPHGNLVIAAHFDQRGVFVIEYYQPMVRWSGFSAYYETCLCGIVGWNDDTCMASCSPKRRAMFRLNPLTRK